MENKGSYIVAGIFIITLTVALLLAVVWVGRFKERKEFDYYYIYMKESVSGLQKDSAVKYMGVQIGKVKRIEVDPENPEEVRITIEVPKGTRILKGMWATLKSIGITGLSYIEISGGSKKAPLLKKREGEIPTIPSRSSMFARLGVSMEDLSFHISRISKKMDEVLSKRNVQNISEILEDLKETTGKLHIFLSQKNVKNIEDTLANLNRASQRLNATLDKIDELVASTGGMPKRVGKLIKVMEMGAESALKTTELIKKGFEQGDYNLREISRGTLDNINQLVDDMRGITARIHVILDTIETSPGDLLFKTSTPLPGPGEGEKGKQ